MATITCDRHCTSMQEISSSTSSPTIARGGDSIDLVDAAATGIKILMVQIRCWSLDSRLYSCLIFWLLPCRIVHITMFPFVYYRICGILIPVAAASTRSIETPWNRSENFCCMVVGVKPVPDKIFQSSKNYILFCTWSTLDYSWKLTHCVHLGPDTPILLQTQFPLVLSHVVLYPLQSQTE